MTLKELMEKQWKERGCADPVHVAAWEKHTRHSRRLSLVDWDKRLTPDENE